MESLKAQNTRHSTDMKQMQDSMKKAQQVMQVSWDKQIALLLGK